MLKFFAEGCENCKPLSAMQAFESQAQHSEQSRVGPMRLISWVIGNFMLMDVDKAGSCRVVTTQ